MAKTASNWEQGWFYSIPRRFFRFPTWAYSLYVGVGFILAGALHYQVWITSGKVENLFSGLGWPQARLSPIAALLLYGALAAAVAIAVNFLLVLLRRRGGPVELVFWGTALSIVASWMPWLFASSIANTLFLFMYGMIVMSGFGLMQSVLCDRDSVSGAAPLDSWRVFASATKACAAVLALVLGTVATSVLLPWRNTDVEGGQLMRYALLSAWMVAGMVGFILMPLFLRALEKPPVADIGLEPPGPL